MYTNAQFIINPKVAVTDVFGPNPRIDKLASYRIAVEICRISAMKTYDAM